MLAALAFMAFVPVPFVVRSPGPTINTLGETDEGHKLIEISGAETFPTGDGELRLTTTSLSGGPSRGIPLFEAILKWIRADSSVLPRTLQYPEDQDQEELSEYLIAQMDASQEYATAAALQHLGYEIKMTMTVAELMPDLPAAEHLEVDDVITAIAPDGGERAELADFTQLTDILESVPPGTAVTLEVDRVGDAVTVSFPTSPRSEGDTAPGSLLGVWLFTEIAELPLDVSFDINRIGGSSAGNMFALAIVDLLTQGEMTGGEVIAGTGTMSANGRVGAIGGVEQKMHASARDGADWFLVPESNCAETVGHVPGGLTVVAVATLEDSVAVVEAIGAGETDGLPTCEAVLADQRG